MKITILIGSLAVFSVLIGVYFFGITSSTDFLSFLSPIWNLFQGLTNILRTVLHWFLNLIGFVSNVLPNPVMEVI